MTSKEHAEVWRRAAKILAAMDPRQTWAQAAWERIGASGASGGTYTLPFHSEKQTAAWDAYNTASYVLNQIAAEYEKADESQIDLNRQEPPVDQLTA